MKPIALITGATSGIGLATAYELANDYNLIICGRRTERLEELKTDLSKKTQILSLTFDVRDRKVVADAISSLPESWSNIEVLINNAGNAHGLAPINEGDLDDWDAMIDINIKGLLYVSRAIIPQMVKARKGYILNVGSIAGIDTYPNGHVYCASKSAVDSISKGMRMDLFKYNIRVSEIKPGLVETEFSEVRFKGDHERAAKVYEGFEPLTAKDIAEIIHFMVTRPPHVNIADTLVLPTAQAASVMVDRK